MDRYILALIKEIKMRGSSEYVIDSIYFGGGSPSILNQRQLGALVAEIFKNFIISTDSENTIECNPDDVTKELVAAFKENHFNRLSLGSQSFLARDLIYLKRTHSTRTNHKAIGVLQDQGIDNFNLDFIIGLPDQTIANLEKNYTFLKKINASHISAYLLEGVKNSGNSPEIESREEGLYFFSRDLLMDLGFNHYEVSNFSKPGYNSHHNLKYWKNETYIGIGLGAFGFLGEIDYNNHKDLNKYFKNISKGILPIKEEKKLDPEKRKIITGLRLLSGIPQSCFTDYPKQLDFLLENKLLLKSNAIIRVNPDKILLLNEILGYFV